MFDYLFILSLVVLRTSLAMYDTIRLPNEPVSIRAAVGTGVTVF